METKHITPHTRVDLGTVRDLTDNGETADARVIYRAARQVGEDDSWIVYADTNGDPVYIGAVSSSGLVFHAFENDQDLLAQVSKDLGQVFDSSEEVVEYLWGLRTKAAK